MGTVSKADESTSKTTLHLSAKQKLESFLLIGYGYDASDVLDSTVLEEWLSEIPDIEVVATLMKVATQVGPVRDDNNYSLAAVLSVCLKSNNMSLRSLAYAAFPKLCLSENFLFFCIKTCQEVVKQKSSPTSHPPGISGDGFRNAIRKFYNSKNSTELAKMLVSNLRQFKWTHKDVVKIAHITTESTKSNAAISYFALGKKEYRKYLSEECEALACLQEELQTCEDPPRIAFLLKDLNKKLSPSDSRFNSPLVWAEYVEYMPTVDVLKYLEYFTKESLRSAVLPRATAVIDRDDGSSVDPVTVYMHLHRYTTSNYKTRQARAIAKNTIPEKSEPNEKKTEKGKVSEATKVRKKKGAKAGAGSKAKEEIVAGAKTVKSDTPAEGKDVKKADEVEACVEKLLMRSLAVAAAGKTEDDWLLVGSLRGVGGMEKVVRGWHVPYSVVVTGLALHLAAAARSLTLQAPSVGNIPVDTSSPANTLSNVQKAGKLKCPEAIVKWTLARAENANKIVIVTDEPLAADADIIAAMNAYRQAKSLPSASLIIFGTHCESAIIEQGIWKFKGFHPSVLSLFCRYCKGELRLFDST